MSSQLAYCSMTKFQESFQHQSKEKVKVFLYTRRSSLSKTKKRIGCVIAQTIRKQIHQN